MTDAGPQPIKIAGMTSRAIVVVLSDLFDEPADILAGLQHLRYKRHEVVVLHVMDGDRKSVV